MKETGFDITFRGVVPESGITIEEIDEKLKKFEIALGSTNALLQREACMIVFNGQCTDYKGFFDGWSVPNVVRVQSNAMIWAVKAKIFGLDQTTEKLLSMTRCGDGMLISPNK